MSDHRLDLSARETAYLRELGYPEKGADFIRHAQVSVEAAASILGWHPLYDRSFDPPRLKKTAAERLSTAILTHAPVVPSTAASERDHFASLPEPIAAVTDAERTRVEWVCLGRLLDAAPDLLRNGRGPRQPLPQLN